MRFAAGASFGSAGVAGWWTAMRAAAEKEGEEEKDGGAADDADYDDGGVLGALLENVRG